MINETTIPYEVLVQEMAAKTIEQLPSRESWPKLIETKEQAQALTDAFKRAEQITVNIEETIARQTHHKVAGRTQSNPGLQIAHAVNAGLKVRLQEVPLNHLPGYGSSGSERRQNYILGAINEIGIEETFDRLPPIVLKIDYYDGVAGALDIVDGNTRIMVAKRLGKTVIWAYCIPV